MLPIVKKLIAFNFTANANSPYYIVIHDTANTSNGANALAHYNYFNGGDRQASAHVFVDATNILQLIEFKDKAWHVGDGAGQYGITNANSIGIEICVNADGDYVKSVSNTIELVVYLMRTYNIPLDRVVRHYDASRKNCPASMSANNWAKWIEFKGRVATLANGATTSTTTDEIIKKGTANATSGLNVRASASSTAGVLGAIGNGATIDILATSGAWYQIKYNGGYGYVYGDYVTITWTKPVEAPKPIAPIPTPTPTPTPTAPIYRVRKTWADAGSQLGAYKDLDTAKELADNNVGFSVFDESGKVIYTKPIAPIPTTIPEVKVVEKIVEKIVEVPVEKIVEKVVEKTIKINFTPEEKALFNTLYGALGKILNS